MKMFAIVNKKNLPYIHRFTRYITFTSILVNLFCSSPVLANTNQSILTRIVPDQLDEHIVYPTNHATLALDPLLSYHWVSVAVPTELVRPGVYIEIWDSTNRPVPGYQSQHLTAATVDISKIDPTLYPSIRVVLFDQQQTFSATSTFPVILNYQATTNTRLFIFLGYFGVVMIILIALAYYWRISFWQTLKQLLVLQRQTTITFSKQHIVQYSIGTLLSLTLLAIALGYYTGIEQIVYLVIKLPILLFGTLAITAGSIIVCLFLFGIHRSAQELITWFSKALLTTSLLLASLSPLVLFYIVYPFNHDQLLTMLMVLFIIAGVGGVISLAQTAYRSVQRIVPMIIIVNVWLVVYGSVLAQLGWMLRPWVGVRDPVQHTVPFARPYSGNVFTEIINTMQRL